MTLEAGLLSEKARARIVTWCLIAGAVVDAIAILSGVLQYGLLARAATGGGITEAEASANDSRHQMIGVLQFVLFFVTGIAWLVWFRRAYANLQAMGTGKSDYSPGWAVGWWFVPIMNLFRPYQLTTEVWLRSAAVNAEESVKGLDSPTLLTLWWGVYIIFGFLARATLSAARNAQQVQQLQDVTSMGIVIDAVGIICAGLALAVVIGIDKLQQRTVTLYGDPVSVVNHPDTA